MFKNYSFIWVALLALGLSSCVLNSKFSQSGSYQTTERVNGLHLVVIGDKDTKEAMDYLSQFLSDSLTKNNIKTTKVYHCCRDENSDLNTLIQQLMPTNYKPDNILVVVVSQTTVGYGTTSSRDMQVDLFNTVLAKHTWNGKVTVNMSWFISDQNYRDVAKSLTKTIMKELRKKKVV